jgi:hypothetical protein
MATYTDSTGGVANTNPIILNSRGECVLWMIQGQAYKFVLQDSLGNPIWVTDNIYGVPNGLFTGNLVINNQVLTGYTLNLTDAVQTLVRMNNILSMTLTVPSNASVAFPIGTNILIERTGAGSLTIVPAGGVSINTGSSYTLRAQYSQAGLIQVSANVWTLVGDLT